MNFEIEKDKPAPEIQSPGRPVKYPFSTMEVNESVFIPCGTNGKGHKHFVDIAHQNGKYQGKKFVSRKQPCGGVRIWRVK